MLNEKKKINKVPARSGFDRLRSELFLEALCNLFNLNLKTFVNFQLLLWFLTKLKELSNRK